MASLTSVGSNLQMLVTVTTDQRYISPASYVFSIVIIDWGCSSLQDDGTTLSNYTFLVILQLNANSTPNLSQLNPKGTRSSRRMSGDSFYDITLRCPRYNPMCVYDIILWCLRYNPMCVYDILPCGVYDITLWCLQYNPMCVYDITQCVSTIQPYGVYDITQCVSMI